MRRVSLRTLVTGAATASSLFVTHAAFAAECPSAADGAVFVRGSSASQKIVEAIAKVAINSGVKVIYSKDGSSCAGGVHDGIDATPGTGYAGGANLSFEADSSTTCTFATPRRADIGVSDVYPSSCAGVDNIPSPVVLPADVQDILGPVQAFTLAVHDDPSFPVAISAEAAVNTFGVVARGGDAAAFGINPWTLKADIFGRPENSGTWQTWSRNLGLPTNHPVLTAADGGGQKAGAGDVLAALVAANRSSAIGIIALNDIVGNPAPAVRPLAFRAKGQSHAFYPSSTSSATDLINVRDGHYATWANLHILPVKTGGSLSANVQTVLTLLEAQEATAAIAKLRAVPKCAMQVSRGSDGGDFSLSTPDKPCGCFFEAQASGTAPATCQTCAADADCGASNQCVFGYCEAKK